MYFGIGYVMKNCQVFFFIHVDLTVLMATLYDPISISVCTNIYICAVHIFIQFLSYSVAALPACERKSFGAPHFHVWPSGYLV